MWVTALERLEGKVFNFEEPILNDPEEKLKKGFYRIDYEVLSFLIDVKSILEEKTGTTGKLYGVYHTNDQQEGAFYNSVVEIEGLSIESVIKDILAKEEKLGFERNSENYGMYTREWVYFKIVYPNQPLWRRVWASMWF